MFGQPVEVVKNRDSRRGSRTSGLSELKYECCNAGLLTENGIA